MEKNFIPEGVDPASCYFDKFDNFTGHKVYNGLKDGEDYYFHRRRTNYIPI